MMKLSVVHAPVCRIFGLEKALQIIKNAGFDRIDYDFICYDKKGQFFPDGYQEQMRKTAELLKQAGLQCDQTHAPAPFDQGPLTIHFGEATEKSNPHFADMIRSLEATALLGASRCVFQCLPVPDGSDSAQFMECNTAYFQALEPYAAACGVKIGIENLEKEAGNLWQAELQNKLLERLGTAHFYALVNLGHAAASETTPDAHLAKLQPEFVQGLVFHDYNTQTDHVVPGLGITDWDKAAEELARMNYQGDLTLDCTTYLRFPETVIPAGLRFAAASGRLFVRKKEAAARRLTNR